MSIITLQRAEDLDTHLQGPRTVIGFFGDFSPVARRARPAFERFARDHDDLPVIIVDVDKVRGVHKRFGVTSVPSAVTVEDGRVIRRTSGEHEPDGWARALLPHAATPPAPRAEGPRHPPITVYVSPTCVWCSRVKAWLREQGFTWREIDVSRDPDAAQELVKRSGQMGVPQIDIGGQIVVGFDKPRLQRLLGLSAA
ncbi:MAG: thioredoxin family protein [Deltaproteobacteria bacterium]|nr:MAG: thioredoxin family protein [Deltaproteobacteria bacterium]